MIETHHRAARTALLACAALSAAACGGGNSSNPFGPYIPRPEFTGGSPPPPSASPPAAGTPAPPTAPAAPPAFAQACLDVTPAMASIGPFKTYAGDCLLSFQVTTADHTALRDNYTADAEDKLRTRVLEAFRTHFADQFDWLIIVLDYVDPPKGAGYGVFSRRYTPDVPAKCRQTSRTDCPKFLGTALFPYSISRDLGIDPLRGGPSLHELMHTLANFDLPTAYGGHWGYSSVNGQLGGWDPATFKDLGGGRYQVKPFGAFANGGNGVPYAPLELFMLGLVPASDVPPIKVANDFQWADPVKGEFSASSIATYTAQGLADKMGDRKPDMAVARKSFRAAVVVVTDKERLTDAQVQLLSHGAGHLSFPKKPETFSLAPGQGVWDLHNFFTATGGRATLSVDRVSSFARQ
jgi:hypothetical protein